MAYVGSTVRVPPKTLTEDEQRRLLRVTGEHKDGFRDHVIFSLALGTGLREHEICALDVLDVTDDGKGVRQRFALRVFKLSNPDKRQQEAILPDAIRYKIQKFLRWKRANDESLEPTDPLFLSRIGRRISVRSLLHNFTQWQKRAGFERHLTFHALRHTACSNLYRATKDLLMVQRMARHASVTSTTIYTHASDEDVLRAVRALPC